MNNEMIQLFFDPSTENIDWEKRQPHINPVKEINNNPEKNNKEKSNLINQTPRITDDFRTYIAEVNKRIDEYCLSGSKELKNRLKDDYKILCVNFASYGRPLDEMLTCIKRLELSVYQNKISNKRTTTRTRIKPQPVYSERGIQIQNRLKEIKLLIKQKKIEPSENFELRSELVSLKDELINKIDIFSNVDNIPIKITQINSYLNRINENTTSESFTDINREQEKKSDKREVEVSGKTQRGIEIQGELAVLREEAKRKDLNPIEKENLTNTLIKLQDEITSNMEQFSKFDSIPVRLDQIENYLKKLKGKEELKPKISVPIQKISAEENEDDGSKKKMRVIWKFGLSK